jgi:hypothetical protein
MKRRARPAGGRAPGNTGGSSAAKAGREGMRVAPLPGNQQSMRALGAKPGASPSAPEEAHARRAAELFGSAAQPAGEPHGACAVPQSSSGGWPLEASLRWRYERFFRADLSHVRIHTGPDAETATHVHGARALTLGSDIYFRPGEYVPQSAEGRELLAHELTHTLQPGGALRTQLDPAARGPAFYQALMAHDYPAAARLLDEMERAEMRAVLRPLPPEELRLLRQAADEALAREPNPVVQAIDEIAAALPPEASPAPAGPEAESIASLPATEKLRRAGEYALQELGPAAARELEALFSPASLAIMAAFIVAFIASQLTPVGWIADLLAFGVLAVSVLFLGLMIIDILGDVVRFFRAVEAASEGELRSAGFALARAIARAGIGIIVALLTRGMGRSAGGPRPRPYSGMALAEVEAAGGAGRAWRLVPVAAPAEAVAPSAVQGLVFSYAAMVPASGGGSGGGGSEPPGEEPGATGGRPPRGPEVFDELSRELGMTTEESAGRSIRDAVADARAAGFIDAEGRPTGSVDLATQPHGSAPTVRSELGLTGAEAPSAHVGPTSGLRGVPGYSRSGANTVLMSPEMHRGFDAHWQRWAMDLRRSGRTDVSVAELYAEMLTAIEQIPGMPQNARNALAWRLQLELFSELGLSPTSRVALPYPNIGP